MIRVDSLFAPKNTLDQPLAHLMACHRRIEERLNTLQQAAAHLEDRPEESRVAFENAFHFLDTSGVLHTSDEEESLFPRLRPLLEPGERTYLASLEHDHTEAHRLYTELKQKLRAGSEATQVRNVVHRLVELYRAHIASEDEVLQAYALQLLRPAHLAEIAAEMKQRRGL